MLRRRLGRKSRNMRMTATMVAKPTQTRGGEVVVELRCMRMTATRVAKPTQSGGGESSGVEVYVHDGHNGCQADSIWRWRG